MKVNDRDLQRLYQDYIRQKPILMRESCPPSKKIINFFSSKLSERQKTKIVDHITTCPECLQEFEFILQTLRYELKINQETKDFSPSEEKISAMRKKFNKIVADLRKRMKLFLPKFSFKYGTLIVGVTVITAFIFIVFFKIIFFNSNRTPGIDQIRSKTTSQITLIGPLGEIDPSTSLSFKWNKLENTEYYILELFDEALILIWKSEEILKNKYILPENIFKKLGKNKPYYWIITAFSSKEKKAESPLEDFILKK